MAECGTATIIPFPTRPGLPARQPKPADSLACSAANLSDALGGLSVALTEQRAALQRWRAAMDGLAASLRVLGAKSESRAS